MAEAAALGKPLAAQLQRYRALASSATGAAGAAEKAEDKAVADYIESWPQRRLDEAGEVARISSMEARGLLKAVIEKCPKTDAARRAQGALVALPAEVQRVIVVAKLKEKSAAPRPADSACAQALAVYTWEIEDVVEGRYDGKVICVAHWVMRDRSLLPEASSKLGAARTLTLEPYDDHEEVQEDWLLDTVKRDLTQPIYVEVEPADEN